MFFQNFCEGATLDKNFLKRGQEESGHFPKHPQKDLLRYKVSHLSQLRGVEKAAFPGP